MKNARIKSQIVPMRPIEGGARPERPGPADETSAPARPLSRSVMFIEFPLATVVFIIAALNIAYRPIWLIALLGTLLLWMFHAYVRWRYSISIPFLVLFFVFAAIQIDAVGNHLHLYQRLPWPVPYDVFAHFTIPALMAPAVVWLIRAGIERFAYRLPTGAVVFFAVAVNFGLSGLYEIVELWDELYFGGRRIWSMHDTSRDLQWGLLGAITGSVVTYIVLRMVRRDHVRRPGERHLRLVTRE